MDLMKLKKEEVGELLDVKRIVSDSYKNTKKIANSSLSGAHRLSPAEKQNINNGKWANDGQSLIGKVNEIMNRDMGLFGKINQELPPVCVDLPSTFFEDEYVKSLMLSLAQSNSFAFKEATCQEIFLKKKICLVKIAVCSLWTPINQEKNALVSNDLKLYRLLNQK